MPELPEVETTLHGIAPHIVGKKVTAVTIRRSTLRWPIPKPLKTFLPGLVLRQLERRAKYLLFKFDTGTLILHLGMSGRLRILNKPQAPQKHDHVDIQFGASTLLRFTDPRRFGALLWTEEDATQHPLLADIGPEPLSSLFTGQYLWKRAQRKKISVKNYIMDSKVVAGVGNIYAAEALFLAGIRPHKAAGELTLEECQQLAAAIKKILKKAITKGGTTLKDFLKTDGSPGYFSLELNVYGREGKACIKCNTLLQSSRIGQRASVYCIRCQK